MHLIHLAGGYATSRVRVTLTVRSWLDTGDALGHPGPWQGTAGCARERSLVRVASLLQEAPRPASVEPVVTGDELDHDPDDRSCELPASPPFGGSRLPPLGTAFSWSGHQITSLHRPSVTRERVSDGQIPGRAAVSAGDLRVSAARVRFTDFRHHGHRVS